MGSREEYAAKWKDPRWQQKRLLIMERDGWTCQRCGDKESTLSVHHRYYIPGADPWDYPDKALVTLCESCHESETEAWPQVIDRLTMAVKSVLWTSECDGIAQAIEHFDPPRTTNRDLVNLVLLVLDACCYGPEHREALLSFLCETQPKARPWIDATILERLNGDGYFKGRA